MIEIIINYKKYYFFGSWKVLIFILYLSIMLLLLFKYDPTKIIQIKHILSAENPEIRQRNSNMRIPILKYSKTGEIHWMYTSRCMCFGIMNYLAVFFFFLTTIKKIVQKHIEYLRLATDNSLGDVGGGNNSLPSVCKSTNEPHWRTDVKGARVWETGRSR